MLTLGCQYKEKRCIQKESDPKEHFEEQLTQGKKKVHRAAKEAKHVARVLRCDFILY